MIYGTRIMRLVIGYDVPGWFTNCAANHPVGQGVLMVLEEKQPHMSTFVVINWSIIPLIFVVVDS